MAKKKTASKSKKPTKNSRAKKPANKKIVGDEFKTSPKIRCSDDDGTYDYVRAEVTEEGIKLNYQVTGLTISGSDFVDDSTASEWSEEEVKKVSASMIGVHPDDAKLIELV